MYDLDMGRQRQRRTRQERRTERTARRAERQLNRAAEQTSRELRRASAAGQIARLEQETAEAAELLDPTGARFAQSEQRQERRGRALEVGRNALNWITEQAGGLFGRRSGGSGGGSTPAPVVVEQRAGINPLWIAAGVLVLGGAVFLLTRPKK